MNTPHPLHQQDYWDENTPWWKAVKKWEQREKLSNQEIQELESYTTEKEDRRVRQLTTLLINLHRDETETIRKNDSLTQFLLRRRNASHLRTLLANS